MERAARCRSRNDRGSIIRFVWSEAPKELRVSENLKKLYRDAAKAQGKTEYETVLEVCVTEAGDVDEVMVVEPASDEKNGIGGVYRGWIHDRGWKYQPYLVNGKPTPFCHLQPLHFVFPPKPSGDN